MIGTAIRKIVERRAKWSAGSHPRDPVLAKILGLQENTSSGISVSRETAIGYPALWRGMNLISGDVAKLPLYVYRYTEGGGKDRARDHAAYRLLRRKASPEMLSYTFKQTLTSHALGEGNGYAYIYRRGDGAPYELVPLLPDRTFPVRRDGVLWYVTSVAGEWHKLEPVNVLHIKGLGFNGLVGYSIFEVLAEAIGLGLALQKNAATFFGNGARPSGILLYPGSLSKEAMANLHATWNNMHKGLENAHKIAIFEEGMKYEQLTMSPEESQNVQTRSFEVRQIANILGIPPHKLGVEGTNTYSSVEQMNLDYLDQALDRWLVCWEEECYDKLLAEEEKANETHTVEFLREAILRADTKTTTETLVTEVNNGLLSADEARAKKNLPALPDGLGKKFRKPENIGLLGEEPVPNATTPTSESQPEEEPAPTPAKPAAQAAKGSRHDFHPAPQTLKVCYTLLADSARRVIKRIGVHARRAASEHRKFCEWLEAFREEHAPVAHEIMAPAIDAYCELIHGAAEERARRLPEVLLDTLHDDMEGIIEHCTPKELAAKMDAYMTEQEEHGAEERVGTLITVEMHYITPEKEPHHVS